MLTKKDIQSIVENSAKNLKEEISSSAKALRDELKAEIVSSAKSLRKEFKKDIEDTVAQVIEFVMKYSASKDDLKEFKEEVKSEFSEVRRQLNDLKADTPTPQEFTSHEKRISKLESAVFPS